MWFSTIHLSTHTHLGSDRLPRQQTESSDDHYDEPKALTESHYQSSDVTRLHYAKPDVTAGRPQIYSTFINPVFYEVVYCLSYMSFYQFICLSTYFCLSIYPPLPGLYNHHLLVKKKCFLIKLYLPVMSVMTRLPSSASDVIKRL